MQRLHFCPITLACPTHTPTLNSSPHCLCPWVLYTCSLTWPFSFPLLYPSPHLSSGHCPFVLYLHVSGSILLTLFSWLSSTVGEIIWYLSFTDGLVSFNIMLSSSIHVVMKGRSSFFLLHSIPLCKCTSFLIQWFADRCLGCFKHLAIVNCAAVNIGLHRFFWIGVSGFLGYNPSSGIAERLKKSSLLKYLS